MMTSETPRALVPAVQCSRTHAAYHEAGHAAAALHIGLPFHYVTIIPSPDMRSGGHILTTSHTRALEQYGIELADYLMYLLAGEAAVSTSLGRVTQRIPDENAIRIITGWGGDLPKALAILRSLPDADLLEISGRGLTALHEAADNLEQSWRSLAASTAVLMACGRAGALFRDTPAGLRGMEAIAHALLCRQWLSYAEAAQIYTTASRPQASTEEGTGAWTGNAA